MSIVELCQRNAARHRSLPFWSWNDRLEIDELLRQIDWMHENGIGGFFMHARSGLKTAYLSEEWMRCVDACIEYAHSLGMDAWVYDENGWPSGFVGGKLLEDEENRDRYLTHSVGAYDSAALVSYRVEEDSLRRCSCGGADGIYLNVYEHLSASTVDVLNPQVTESFLALTHEKYKERYGSLFAEKLCGFFTDEPQYYRWNTPYSKMIVKYFDEVLHEDILDGLGLLFLKKNGYRRFRYHYWRGMQQLLVENYAGRVYRWCENNGVSLTGHYIEESSLSGQMQCCAGIMPLYEYEHIPGIDWLGRFCNNQLTPRQVASVAAQLGKERVLCEMYACGGWDTTPRELKMMTDYLYLNGVNLTCQHLLPYSERGNRIHDHPAHYFPGNPWVKDSFEIFNRYFTRLGALIANSTEPVCVAVLHPIRSAYFDYDRALEEEDFGIGELERLFSETLERLERCGIAYHLLDETLLAKYGRVQDGQISCGKCTYDYLILPGCSTMDSSTELLLRQYVQQGGKVLICGDMPAYLEGEPYSYDYLSSTVGWEELLAACPVDFSAEGGKLCVSLRRSGQERFLMVLNHSDTQVCKASFAFADGTTAFEQTDILTGESRVRPLSITLNPGQAAILTPCRLSPPPETALETVCLAGGYRVLGAEENALVVDTVSYSTDGVHYSQRLSVPMAFRRLLEERFAGRLILRYSFAVAQLPASARLETQMSDIGEIRINGREYDAAQAENIAPLLQIGENTVEIIMDYRQDQAVYDVLFGENVTESLKNCLVYHSELEPLLIKGDFGVYETEGFRPGDTAGVLRGSSFAIGARPEEISSLVAGGFPFFAGRITLGGTFRCETGRVLLRLPGRWHTAEVRVNGVPFDKLLFTDLLNVSEAVKPGENSVEVIFTIGNRNLYGPHHYAPEEEPLSQGPFMFEFPDLDDRKGDDYFRADYAFVEPLATV